jgi:hypothetical protein
MYLSVTRVVLLLSSSMLVSQGIDPIISALEEFEIETIPLRHMARKLDSITTRASIALKGGYVSGVYRSLS